MIYFIIITRKGPAQARVLYLYFDSSNRLQPERKVRRLLFFYYYLILAVFNVTIF